jgi:hypothetical protein
MPNEPSITPRRLGLRGGPLARNGDPRVTARVLKKSMLWMGGGRQRRDRVRRRAPRDAHGPFAADRTGAARSRPVKCKLASCASFSVSWSA